MAIAQTARQARLRLALGGETLGLRSLRARERLSEPFVITIEAISTATDIDFLPHLGQPAAVDIYDAREAVRHFHGVLTEAAYLETSEAGHHYELTLRPWMWLLKQGLGYQVFQNKTALEIITETFHAAGFSNYQVKLSRELPKREYCVKFRESDFDFVSRLMEEEGVYYYFEHMSEHHVLTLCDGPTSHRSIPEYESLPYYPPGGEGRRLGPYVRRWSERVTTVPTQIGLRDYDFERPDDTLNVAVQASGPGPAAECYDYPGRYTASDRGQTLAQTRLESARAKQRIFFGEAEAAGVACGARFGLHGHENGRFDGEYLIAGLDYTVRLQDYAMREARMDEPLVARLEAIPADVRWRPPLRTPRPVPRGPETALVTGPAGETVHVDKYGRIKIRFYWDRLQPADDTSSCWVRVSQGWAGAGFGLQALPRVGQEVIVDFLDGDPDRPIVTGRVHNQNRMPAYTLPDDKTRSLWRTQTVGQSGDYAEAEDPPSGVGANELRFEDKGGSEELYVHAQRDMKTWVRLDQDLKVGRDRTERAGRDRTTRVKRNETTVVETGDERRTVQAGSRTTSVCKDDALSVEQGDHKTTVSLGNMTAEVNVGDYSLKTALGSITLEAMQQIELKVGQSSIVIDQMGVTIKGAITVDIEAQVELNAKGAITQVTGSAMTIVKGGLITLN